MNPRDVAIREQYVKLIEVVSKKAAYEALTVDHGIGKDRIIQILKAEP